MQKSYRILKNYAVLHISRINISPPGTFHITEIALKHYEIFRDLCQSHPDLTLNSGPNHSVTLNSVTLTS